VRNGDASRNLNQMASMPNINMVPAAHTAAVPMTNELRFAG
jgi:hypothetical protein